MIHKDVSAPKSYPSSSVLVHIEMERAQLEPESHGASHGSSSVARPSVLYPARHSDADGPGSIDCQGPTIYRSKSTVRALFPSRRLGMKHITLSCYLFGFLVLDLSKVLMLTIALVGPTQNRICGQWATKRESWYVLSGCSHFRCAETRH
jgi:hypothetical protein